MNDIIKAAILFLVGYALGFGLTRLFLRCLSADRYMTSTYDAMRNGIVVPTSLD